MSPILENPLQRSKYTLDDILQACHDFNSTFGFVNYAEIGRRLGLSRQAVHLRLKDAKAKGLLDEYTHGRFLRPGTRSDRVDLHLKVAPETRDFLNSLSDQLDVRIATLVDSAVALYRERIRDDITINSPSSPPTSPSP